MIGLKTENIKPDLFWYNPNIHPFTEYRSRRDFLAAYARENQLELITEDEYGLRKFIEGAASVGIAGTGRCLYCYNLRLEKTASLAAEKGYDSFSTSLLTSPYQQHDLIKQAGQESAAKFGVEFFYRDFRPFFREGQKIARDKGTYMQKYCGCIFSEEERYLKK